MARTDKRAERMEEQQRVHRRRALYFVSVCFAIAIAYTAFILIMMTHMPNVLEDELIIKGEYFTTVEMEWDHLAVEHNSDLSVGDMAWEVTKGVDNETLFDGMQGEEDDELIVVKDLGPGEFGVYLKPTGVNAAKEYDVRIMEFYIAPGTIGIVKMLAALVLVVLIPFLWFSARAPATRNYREEYRFASLAILMTMVLSAVVMVTPWY